MLKRHRINSENNTSSKFLDQIETPNIISEQVKVRKGSYFYSKTICIKLIKKERTVHI